MIPKMARNFHVTYVPRTYFPTRDYSLWQKHQIHAHKPLGKKESLLIIKKRVGSSSDWCPLWPSTAQDASSHLYFAWTAESYGLDSSLLYKQKSNGQKPEKVVRMINRGTFRKTIYEQTDRTQRTLSSMITICSQYMRRSKSQTISLNFHPTLSLIRARSIQLQPKYLAIL